MFRHPEVADKGESHAFQRGFADAVPHAGKEASEFLDTYVGELEWFLTVQRAGTPRDPFAADLALARGIAETIAKATAAGAAVLVEPYAADGREAALVRFPGGYVAEIHAFVGK